MRTLMALGKIVAILVFITNTGIFSELARVASGNSETKYDPETNRAVVAFCEQKYTAATAKVKQGEPYSPYDYFRDLTDVYNLEDSLKTPSGFMYDGKIMDLQKLSYQFIGKGKPFSDKDIYKAREEVFKPRNEKRFLTKSEQVDWKKTGSDLFFWFLSQYLRGFLPAFILFLVWIGRGGDVYGEKKLRLRSPISFTLSLLIYPVVIGTILRRWFKITGRGLYAGIELHRTKKKFLTILSDDEIAAVKRFARSNLKLGEWKKELLGRGLTFHRSFALGAVSLVVCFIVFGASRAYTETKPQREADSISMSVVNGSSGGTEYSPSVSKDTVPPSNFAILEDDIIWFVQTIRVVLKERVRVLLGSMKNVEHIPVSRLANHFINDLLTRKEKGEYENDILNITDNMSCSPDVCAGFRRGG